VPVLATAMSISSLHIRLTVILLLSLFFSPGISLGEPPPNSVDIVYCDYRPFFFKGGNGEPRGLLVDFWQLWAQKTGIKVRFRMAKSWGETVRLVASDKADINAAIYYTPERDKHLDFSNPFFNLSAHIFYNRSMKPPAGLDDLSGTRVGVVVEDYTAQFLHDNRLRATLVPYPNYESLVLGAIHNEVDAFVMEEPVAMSYLSKHGGLNTILKVEKPLYSKGFLAGVKDGRQELVREVNRGIAAISAQELDAIIRNWTGLPKAYSAQKRKVTVVTSDDHIPYYFRNEQGEMTGMLVDIWRLWSEKTGIEVDFKGMSFSDSLARVRDGSAEIHGGCFYSDSRDTYLDYAAFLTKSKTHFFFHESVYGVKNLEDLIGFKIGVMAQDFAIEYIRQKLPGAVLSVYETNTELYEAVKKGEVRAFVGDTLTALFYLAKLGILHEWRHHVERPLYEKDFYAAVREGDVDTSEMIKEGMDAISPQEQAAIERRWTGVSDVNTKDTLVIAMPVNQAPFSMLNADGNPAGMFADLWRLWAKKTGDDIELRGYTWEESIAAVKNGDADIHACLPQITAKMEAVPSAASLYEFPVHLFFRSETPPGTNLLDFLGQQVGVIRGSPEEQWLRTNQPSIELVAFQSEEAMVQAALQGRIQAFIAVPMTMQPMLSKLGWLSTFRYEKATILTREIAPAVTPRNAELVARLEAGFNRISYKEKRDLESRWISDPENRYYSNANNKIYLTSAEKEWLQNHTVRMGTNPHRAPFEFIDDQGEYLGMVSDYMKILEQRLGLKLSRVAGPTWSEVLAKAEASRKEIDMVPCLVPTEERKQKLLFSSPYLNFPWVLISRKQNNLIGNIRDLYGKTVAVVRDYAIREYLQRDHPQIKLSLVDSVEDALKAVSIGAVDAYAGNLSAASYLIEKNNLSNLTVAASTPYGNDYFAIGVRSDWPELVSILNKGIQSLTQKEHDEIRRKWFSVAFNPGLDRAFVTRTALQIGGLVLVIFSLVLLWNKQIRRREEWFRGLTEHGSDIILSFEDDGAITYQSPSHKQILGYERSTLLGTSVHELVHHDDLPQWREILTTLREKDGSATFTLRFREQQGRYRYFEFHCVNLLDNVALQSFVLTGRDLSERIKVEDDLQLAKEEAETASRVKSEFLASMSHEIRTPLNSILGMTEITLHSALASEQRENLKIVKDAARHLLEIINDILDLSKIEAGKLKIQAFEFDLIELLESIVRTYRAEAVKKGVELELRCSLEAPYRTVGDPLRLRQILINLIGNALKFTHVGKVTVEAHLAEEVTLNAAGGPGQLIRFAVRDTGIGIAPDKIGIIFDSFSQGHGPLETTNSGTGLGLAICKKYIDLMGGSIWATSKLGEGSTFIFQLGFEEIGHTPGNATSQEDTSIAREMPAAVRSLSILLAEDSPDNAHVARKFLESMGHHVVAVTDGLQAVERSARQTFDLILMDLQMPLLSGLDAAAMIRRGEAGGRQQSVPIVAMTAHVLEEYQEQCERAGMNGFLPKPVEPKALAKVIAQVTSRPREEQGWKPSFVEKPSNGAVEILDREKALQMLGGDNMLLREVLEIFLQETPPVVEGLQAAVAAGDCRMAFVKAHTLKGSCARIGALACVELAGSMQKSAERDNVVLLKSQLESFNEGFSQLITLLEQEEANGIHTS